VRVLTYLWLTFGLSVAHAGSSVTVVVDYEQPHSAVSFKAMQRQLRSVMDRAGVKLDLRNRHELPPNAQFSDLVVFKMKGYCGMDEWPVAALSDERGALAMAYSSDGQVLPFGEVNCDRIRASLQRVLGKGRPEIYQPMFGTALGLIMAHEMYHMLGNAPVHTKGGITKESLSARELLDSTLSIPAAARDAIQAALSDTPGGARFSAQR
jgi:hypothetical protein